MDIVGKGYSYSNQGITITTVASGLSPMYQQARDTPPILGLCPVLVIQALATSLASWTLVSIEQVVVGCQ